jgi:hypothetical protein
LVAEPCSSFGARGVAGDGERFFSSNGCSLGVGVWGCWVSAGVFGASVAVGMEDASARGKRRMSGAFSDSVVAEWVSLAAGPLGGWLRVLASVGSRLGVCCSWTICAGERLVPVVPVVATPVPVGSGIVMDVARTFSSSLDSVSLLCVGPSAAT